MCRILYFLTLVTLVILTAILAGILTVEIWSRPPDCARSEVSTRLVSTALYLAPNDYLNETTGCRIAAPYLFYVMPGETCHYLFEQVLENRRLCLTGNGELHVAMPNLTLNVQEFAIFAKAAIYTLFLDFDVGNETEVVFEYARGRLTPAEFQKHAVRVDGATAYLPARVVGANIVVDSGDYTARATVRDRLAPDIYTPEIAGDLRYFKT